MVHNLLVGRYLVDLHHGLPLEEEGYYLVDDFDREEVSNIYRFIL